MILAEEGSGDANGTNKGNGPDTCQVDGKMSQPIPTPSVLTRTQMNNHIKPQIQKV